MTILDHNEHRKDSSLGSTSFQLQKLLEDATQENIKMPVLKDGKDRGELLFDLYVACESFMPDVTD